MSRVAVEVVQNLRVSKELSYTYTIVWRQFSRDIEGEGVRKMTIFGVT